MRLTNRYSQALQFAFKLHKDQKRKATPIPYLSHLISVSALVLEHGGNEDEAIAALLHDAVEDQGGLPTLIKIERKFGKKVAKIVEGCTDCHSVPKPPWKQRKEKYLDRLVRESASIQLVSAADKLHNVRTLIADYRVFGDNLWKRFTAGRDGTLWYYAAVSDILKLGKTPIALELDRAVSELKRLSRNA